MSSENELIFEKVKKDPETLALIESLKDNSSLKIQIDWLYFWVIGEIYDLKALSEAISQRELVQKQIQKAITKKSDAKEDLGNL